MGSYAMLMWAARFATEMLAADVRGSVEGPDEEHDGVYIKCARTTNYTICSVADAAAGTTAVALCQITELDNYSTWGDCSGSIKQLGSDEVPDAMNLSCPVGWTTPCRIGKPNENST